MIKRIDSAAVTGVPDTILRSGFEDGEGPGGGGFTTNTIYVGNAEFVTRGTQTFTRRHVGGFLIVRNEGATTERNFLLKDHLGSVDTIVTDLGGLRLIQKMSFDAYGLRREAFQGNWNATSLAQQLGATESLNTTQGYTGHEQVDGVGLIHMGGRLYDPRIGRFIQADPIVDDGTDPQAFNRYAYVGNNPMSVTDPTGYSRAKPFGVALFGFIVMNAIVPGSGFAAWQVGLTYAAQGAAIGAVASGNAKGAMWGAISSVAFWGVGQAVPGLKAGTPLSEALTSGQHWAHVAAHAFTAGTLAELQGGDFGHAFFTAGVTATISPAYSTAGGAGQGGRAVRIAIAAMVGGSLSYANGGNFGQGAIVGAMQQALNHDGNHGGCDEACEIRGTHSALRQIGVQPAAEAMSEAGDAVSDIYLAAAPVPMPKVSSWWARLKRAMGFGDDIAAASPLLSRKLDYFFGKATGNAHSIERSTSMLRQLERIGLPDNPSSRQYMLEHLSSVVADSSNIAMIQANGRILRESLLTGPRGVLKFETVWEGDKLITGTLLGGR